jgi:putative ABC transport system permease protein
MGFMDELHVRAANITDMQAALGEVQEMMRIQRRLKPAQEDNFAMQTAEGALEGWKKISRFLMMALPMLVGISVVVGGIVIMNIMLMAVAERTVEIGIRKALGARRRDILAQFVVESATISTVGAGRGHSHRHRTRLSGSRRHPPPRPPWPPWSVGAAVISA